MSEHSAENDYTLAEAIVEISRQGQEIVRLNLASENGAMRAFLAGWYAHARKGSPYRPTPEEAWAEYRDRVIPPASSTPEEA